MQPSPGSRRIPTLDGWRGVAILMVLIDHVWKSPTIPAFSYLGQHGVTIFFVLSGFLITSNLLNEVDATGTIRLNRFYIRRFFRLMPCAWLYLGVLTLIYHHHHTTDSGLIPSLFFYRNYQGTSDLNRHFWTLSIEEQFYLVWPTVVLLLRRRAWAVAVVGCIIVCIWRAIEWNYLQSAPISTSFMTQFRADSLLLGCLLAIFIQNIRPFLRPWLVFPLLAALFGCVLAFHKVIPMSESVVIALLLGVTSNNPESWLSRLLEFKWLVQIGLISYSVYIWQEFTLLHWGGPFYLTPILTTGTALILGYLSYRFVERPFTRFGRSLSERPHLTTEAATV